MQVFTNFNSLFIAFYKPHFKKISKSCIYLLSILCVLHANAQPKIIFPYTGKVQRWNVPSCVQKIKIEVWGAQGGGSLDCENAIMVLQDDGGLGGYSSGVLDVQSGQLLYIVVGGQGKTGLNNVHDGGYNGGGDGGVFGAGGGGATDIRTILHDLDSRLIVAGGGGGGNTGFPNAGSGGAGGGTLGQDGIALYHFSPGGGGGTQVFGGAAGYAPGEAGSWGFGGNAGNGPAQFHISGGGGGWYGGGSAYGAGGGGGSSNLWGVSDSNSIVGVRQGNGLVVITLLESDLCSNCDLTCRSQINISMPVNECYIAINADQVLSSVTNECTTFGYNLQITYPFGTNALAGFDLDRSHLGQTLIYSVSNQNGNTCWGYLKVEDKSSPVAGCNGTRTISCSQIEKLLEINTQVIDNCSTRNTATIENMTFEDFGCNDPRGLGQISRTILAIDAWGNASRCSDLLIIAKDSIEEIQAPDLITLNCKVVCKTPNVEETADLPDYEEIIFSKDPASKFYPHPELLISLQKQDSFNANYPCLPAYLNTVPYLYDSVLVWDEGEYIFEWQKISLYSLPNRYCKIQVRYKDEIIPLCSDGSGFKIRREWAVYDWCGEKETFYIQYIHVLDKEGPKLIIPATGGIHLRDDRLYYRSSVDPHSCYATTELKELIISDCNSNIKQAYTVTYSDPSNNAKAIVQSGKLPGQIKLPANQGIYGVRCHTINVTLSDACLNRTDTMIQVCVIDDQPPEVLATENTVSTVDPATCWSRIYAKDLDRGSKDNCCNVLHFAIATMDSINAARKYVYDAIIAQCGIRDYKASQEYYDFYIEDYISSYIFKDYLDLNACASYQVVLRVWEACGIPQYDPHIFPYAEHYWFLYNAGYPRSHYRADHNLNFGFSRNANYSKFKAPKDINWRYPLIFCDPPLKEWFALAGLDDYRSAYPGSGAPELCNFDFYFPRLGLMAGSFYGDNIAPGNTCSRMLWKDVMVMVRVDDKTPPIAEKPRDLFLYCDNVYSEHGNVFEYADCNKFPDNLDWPADGTCRDYKNIPYAEIECVKENDGILTDALDGIGKPFGWYGCASSNTEHTDEHGNPVPCDDHHAAWAPVYCHSWLCLDRFDQAGKTNPSDYFYTPRFRNSIPASDTAGQNKFWIWDNCEIVASSLKQKDSSIINNCGTGWLSRTWTASDKCGNLVTTSQKIIVKHRSDFEVIFPQDHIAFCTAKEGLTPSSTGSPIISDDECELVGITYKDEIFDIVSDACYKIVRTWQINDWCADSYLIDPDAHTRNQDIIVNDSLVADTKSRACVFRNVKDNGDGYISYKQIIKVFDSIPPQIHMQDTTFCILDTVCSTFKVDFNLNAFDDCTPVELLRYRWEIDNHPSALDLNSLKYNRPSIDLKSAGDVKRFTAPVISGVSLIHIMVSDRCGNEDTTSFRLTVKDCKKPTPYCYNGVATVIMPSNGSIIIWAKDLNAGSYDNCTPDANLGYSFSSNKENTNKTLTCSDIVGGKISLLPIDIYVWDEAGLFDFCRTYVSLQDGIENSCPDSFRPAGERQVTPNANVEDKRKIEIKSTDKDRYFSLSQNIPNPFSSITQVQFNLPYKAGYRLEISDVTGKIIKSIYGAGLKGFNQLQLDGNSMKHSGIYYYTLYFDGLSSTKKMVIIN